MRATERAVPCNLCGADDYRVVFEPGTAQRHRIVTCRRCGLMYANPQTDNVGAVEDAHVVTDEERAAALAAFDPETHQYLKKQYLQLRDYGRIIDFVDRPDKGLFVEVGSYAGVFLNEAKQRGWDVLGIEPLELPALYSEERFGIPVIREYFEEADIADGSVDVVVANHVIEHVPDPVAFVTKAYELLSPGGVLVMETPTYDSLMFKLLRSRERSVRCDGHIFFFTEASFRKLVEDRGFEVRKYEKVGRTLTLDRLAYNVGVITGQKQPLERLSSRIGLDKFVLNINMRDMQRIYCVKP